jgi:hypothetical protein
MTQTPNRVKPNFLRACARQNRIALRDCGWRERPALMGHDIVSL